MPPVTALYLLIWVFAADHTEHTVFFEEKYSRIECKSKATELQERQRRVRLKTDYSRFVCVPLPSSE